MTTGTKTTPWPAKQLRIPLIIFKNLPTHNDLAELLEEHCTSIFMIKPRQDHAKIMLTTPEDYRSLTSVLMEQKLKYHTFSLTTVKGQHFVIRGLPAHASLAHISRDLSELGLPIQNIMQIILPTDKNKKFPLFIVTMSASQDGKPADLSIVTRLCSCTATTEAPKGKRGPVVLQLPMLGAHTPLLSAIRNQGVYAVEGNIPPNNAPAIEKQNLQYVQTAQETTQQATVAAPTYRKQKRINHKSEFLNHKRKKDFVVAGPTHPTHYSVAAQRKPDILDRVVMKNLSQSMEQETLTALTSDHNPVLITVGDEIEWQQQGSRYSYKKADWYLYKRSLDETLTLDPIHCIKDIDQAVDRFIDAVHTAIKGSIPQQKPQRCSIYTSQVA
ncbi:hypothetical protein NDU88_003532 [Pleurodeles waltl]|uniref:Uncharacterized protein n=1 Tax=Pleurodeles waltl TaxID=8319 RepID=A0AAV7PD46_PLEWA|nr:hypothetical protein NDU88_003532 [Pleurodeles waltl]